MTAATSTETKQLETAAKQTAAAAPSKAREPLYVVKVGSASLDAGGVIFEDIRKLSLSGRRVLVVMGGGSAIERQYASEGRTMVFHTLSNGDQVRTADAEDIATLVRAYETAVIPQVTHQLRQQGLRAFVAPAFSLGLVEASRNRPIKVNRDGKSIIVRDHLVGQPLRCQTRLLQHLLENHDVVCLTAPVADADVAGGILNTDADLLAAFLAVTLKADHVRFVTGTPGILRQVDDPASVVTDIFPGDELDFVRGRMKQKMRAAHYVIEQGNADVRIVGPHALSQPLGSTHIWPLVPPHPAVKMLTQAASINSVSTDETEFVNWLVSLCQRQGVRAWMDEAGNFVASKGEGVDHLMMLSHVDTVPGPWRPVLNEDGHVCARGIVDAKGSLINFVEALLAAEVPAHGKLTVVGAVEEEVTSSKGAFHIRDTMPADAVIIGEPSRYDTLTLGYYGLLKLRILAAVPHAHSAGKGIVSAPDLMVTTVAKLRSGAEQFDPEGIDALISAKSWSDPARQFAEGILNFRLSPKADLAALLQVVAESEGAEVSCEILCATPGYTTGRTCELARSFNRAFAADGIKPRYVVKKGTSDMNTLATTWTGVDMVAYGPGDSSLDHTSHEFITAEEYQQARQVLDKAIQNWFTGRRPQP
ncbi:M20/M25/M40 family metallo-hydrolase [Chitinimonas arctica]|uniref:M20/M25/M40 family metallo-hydrolase n=1 Tax=Chitinimonas arctica TaxID=2594795 RepID=A0A516SBE7_9NEIS|nr:M20/M25/M40 family metallo-hydrolase [Chitinimonas arctica]QDQ25477.1 M20/M25/M40 family metallo-hydrolase [Chitinimonas arctica]